MHSPLALFVCACWFVCVCVVCVEKVGGVQSPLALCVCCACCLNCVDLTRSLPVATVLPPEGICVCVCVYSQLVLCASQAFKVNAYMFMCMRACVCVCFYDVRVCVCMCVCGFVELLSVASANGRRFPIQSIPRCTSKGGKGCGRPFYQARTASFPGCAMHVMSRRPTATRSPLVCPKLPNNMFTILSTVRFTADATIKMHAFLIIGGCFVLSHVPTADQAEAYWRAWTKLVVNGKW